MKKRVVALAMVGIMMLSTVACGSSDSSSESSSKDEISATEEGGSEENLPEGVKSMDEFTITLFSMGQTNVERQMQMKIMAELYNEMYPNATVDIQTPDSPLEVLQTQLAGGTGPDVFTHQTRLAAFAEAGYLYDLSDQPWTEYIVEGAMPDCYYDGKYWAAPSDCNGWGMYYNKAIFEDELGLSIPTTWDEFMECCQVIKDAGYTPLATGGGEAWVYQGVFLTLTSFLYGANENFHVDLYNGEASLDGPEMRDLFDALQESYDAGYWHEGTASIDLSTVRDMIGKGEVVMAPGCPGVITPVEEEDSYDLDLGFFYPPDRNGYTCLPVIGNQVISVNADYEYASTRGVDLVSCFVAAEALGAVCDNITPTAFTSEVYTPSYETTGGQAYQDAFDEGPVVLQCTSWLPSSVYNLYQQIVSSILTGNGYTDQMLADMQAQYEADIDNVNILLD